jgi:hypothetical protein
MFRKYASRCNENVYSDEVFLRNAFTTRLIAEKKSGVIASTAAVLVSCQTDWHHPYPKMWSHNSVKRHPRSVISKLAPYTGGSSFGFWTGYLLSRPTEMRVTVYQPTLRHSPETRESWPDAIPSYSVTIA